MKICIFERSNAKSHFSKTKIYFHKKATPQLLEHAGLQNIKVGVKKISGDLPQYFKFVRWMLTSSLNRFALSFIHRFPVEHDYRVNPTQL